MAVAGTAADGNGEGDGASGSTGRGTGTRAGKRKAAAAATEIVQQQERARTKSGEQKSPGDGANIEAAHGSDDSSRGDDAASRIPRPSSGGGSSGAAATAAASAGREVEQEEGVGTVQVSEGRRERPKRERRQTEFLGMVSGEPPPKRRAATPTGGVQRGRGMVYVESAGGHGGALRYMIQVGSRTVKRTERSGEEDREAKRRRRTR